MPPAVYCDSVELGVHFLPGGVGIYVAVGNQVPTNVKSGFCLAIHRDGTGKLAVAQPRNAGRLAD